MAKILVIGSDLGGREALALIMGFGGHLCETTDSVEEAVNLLPGQNFDLVVVGPGFRGATSGMIARSMKDVSPGLKVLVISENRESEVTAVIDQVLAIPCELADLFHCIDLALERVAGSDQDSGALRSKKC